MANDRANSVTIGLVAAGGVIGALVGMAASRLFIRADSQVLARSQQAGPQGLKFSLSSALPIAIAAVGLVRQIAALGGKED